MFVSKNIGRWSVISTQKHPQSKWASKTLVNILSISVALVEVIRVGELIRGNRPNDELALRNILASWSNGHFIISKLKSPKTYTFLRSLKTVARSLL